MTNFDKNVDRVILAWDAWFTPRRDAFQHYVVIPLSGSLFFAGLVNLLWWLATGELIDTPWR